MADRTSRRADGEGERLDRKSLRTVTGKSADFGELAKDCVCFANGSGGQILVGIEDDATEASPDQRVPADLLDRIRKRVGELTVNVDVAAEVRTSANGGEYVVSLRQAREGRFSRRPGGRRGLARGAAEAISAGHGAS